MKKENIIGILIYLVVFAIAIVYGFTVLQTHFNHSSIETVGMYALYIIVSVLGGVIITGILQEFGHFLGAKTGGYKVIFWNLFYFCFLVEDGKRKFKFKTFDGLTGETRIVPNFEKKARPNPYPFLLYGTIFNVAWIIACAFLFFSYNKNDGLESDIAYFFLTMGIIALLATIYNIIPLKLDSTTDGYRLLQVKGNIEGYNNFLVNEHGGVSLENKSTSNEQSEKKPTKFIAEAALNEVYSLLEEKKYDEAFNKLDEIFSNENLASNRVLLDAKAQYIYATIFSKEKSEYEEYYEKEVPFSLRRELSNEYSLPILRTYLLTAGLLDNSKSEVLLTLKKVVKAYKNVPANRKHTELVL